MMDKSTVQGHFFQQVANLEFQVSADYAPYYLDTTNFRIKNLVGYVDSRTRCTRLKLLASPLKCYTKMD